MKSAGGFFREPGRPAIRYADSITHYDVDSLDVPMPEDFRYFRRHQERRRLETLARLFPRGNGARALDAGTGHGWLAQMLSGRGFSVTCLDLGTDSIRRAAERLRVRSVPAEFVRGDVRRMPFPDASFDAVAASEILEHLDLPGEALAEAARVLRPGGILVVCTPWRERIEYTLCIHCNRKTPVNAHLHSFDEAAMTGLLEGAGFTVERIVRFMSRPAERLGFAGFTGFLPHPLWRAADAVFRAAAGRASCMAVRAVRNE